VYRGTTIAKMTRTIRFVCLCVWVAAPAVALGSILLYPNLFTADALAAFLLEFEGAILMVYLAMSAFRGLSLLPSTPLIIAGTLLFPTEPVTVLGISVAGIFLSSTMIYFFSDYLGFSEFFKRHKPEQINKIKLKLEKPTGFLFIMLWSFFPFVPTDAVCYVAGTTKVSFPKFILAVLAGETILCSFYVFSGRYFLI
jgi:uncharacterized membrane protein YdjX (TVP38/TMEM64 family)